MAAEGHWHLNMVPVAIAVARQFSYLAGAWECRDQWFKVLALPEGYVEILIEEPR